MAPLRVGLDGRYLELRRGMGNVLYSLIEALGRLPRAPELWVYVQERTSVPASLGPVYFRTLPRAPYPVWEQLLVPRAARADRVDVLHSPANTGPLRLPRRTAHVVTVHDAMFMLPEADAPRSPSAYQRLGRRYRRMVVPAVARRAAAVITHSEHARSDIRRLLGVPAGRLHVVQPASGERFRVLPGEEVGRTLPAGLPAGSPWVVTLGAVDPRKNTVRALEAFAHFRAAGYRGHRLLVVGLDHDSGGRLLERARGLRIAEHVTLRGYVSEAELVALYNAAQMFLYPSLYEGFGLPVLEAMACGTPVIASCRTSIPEIAGGAALLVDPTDAGALAGAMAALAGDEPLRRRLSDLGLRQAAGFSWQRTAADVVRVYQAVARR